MFDVAASLLPALSQARESLARTAHAADPAGMADLAKQTLFSEALMNAVHARLAEVKSVTHG